MDYTIGRFLKLIVTIIILAVIGWLLYILSSTITIIIISGLIAYILDPVASYFEYKGLSRTKSTIVIFLAIAAVVAVIVSYLTPPLINELSNIKQGIESGSSEQYFNQIEKFIQNNIPLPATENLDIQSKISELVIDLSNKIFSIIGSVFSVITTLVIIPFAVFFLLKDGHEMKKALVSVIPNRYFEMILNILYKIDHQLGGYLRGQFFDALTVGVLSIIALWILGVNYFLMIGIFAGLANMIPYVGPIAGAIPAVFVVLMFGGGGQDVLLVILAFAIIQLLDNVIIQPLVVAKSVDLHPLIVVFAVIVGGQFFGILGMLLAVPITGMIKVLTIEFYSGIKKYNVL
jgi:predicted PurR-regulated permease PerM